MIYKAYRRFHMSTTAFMPYRFERITPKQANRILQLATFVLGPLVMD